MNNLSTNEYLFYYLYLQIQYDRSLWKNLRYIKLIKINKSINQSQFNI